MVVLFDLFDSFIIGRDSWYMLYLTFIIFCLVLTTYFQMSESSAKLVEGNSYKQHIFVYNRARDFQRCFYTRVVHQLDFQARINQLRKR